MHFPTVDDPTARKPVPKAPEPPPKPIFHSKRLHKTVKEHSEVFDKHRDGLTQMTADYAELEKYLRSRHIAFAYHHECGGVFSEEANSKVALCWEVDKSSNFRLMLSFPDENAFSIPVLESTIKQRAAVYPYLEEFVTGFAAHLANVLPNGLAPKTHEEPSFTEDDIPF